MNELKLIQAKLYFMRKMRSVFVENQNNNDTLESFKEYLNHNYKNNCYYYSAYALMGLKDNDYLVRGTINLRGNANYFHGWVEFSHHGTDYVFDNLADKYIISKKEYYSETKPNITFKCNKVDMIKSFNLEAISKNLYMIRSTDVFDFYNYDIYQDGVLLVKNNKIKGFRALDHASY